MQAVLISIKPKWCDLIADGKKTIEVRKTKPKLERPFKVYIYCTKPPRGKVHLYDAFGFGNNAVEYGGKVIGEFVCRGMMQPCTTLSIMAKESCLTEQELCDYSKGKPLYGWRITDLVIYDKPRELDGFIIPSKLGCVNEGKCRGCKYLDRGNGYNVEDDCNAKFSTDDYKPLRKAPQSWCYVEEQGNCQ